MDSYKDKGFLYQEVCKGQLHPLLHFAFKNALGVQATCLCAWSCNKTFSAPTSNVLVCLTSRCIGYMNMHLVTQVLDLKENVDLEGGIWGSLLLLSHRCSKMTTRPHSAREILCSWGITYCVYLLCSHIVLHCPTEAHLRI